MKRVAGVAITILIVTAAIIGGYSLYNLSNPSPSPTAPPLTATVSSSPISPTPTPTIKISPYTVGICVHSLSLEDARIVNASGARWIRIDCNNSDPEFAQYLQNAKTYNLSVLAILDSWMFNGNTNFTLDGWNTNVTHYVSQYSRYVNAWEIWNEPANPAPNWTLLNLTIYDKISNSIIEENMTKIVDFYYQMAQTAYPIIRQNDPNATILLFGGLNLYSPGAANFELDKAFSSQLSAKGIEQYGDVISIHAYPWGPINQQVWQSYVSSLAYYRGLFTNKSLDVWVTETGQNIRVDGEDKQTQYLTDALFHFNGQATHVFWYSLRDENPARGDFGLVGNDSAPRQAYVNLQNTLAG